MKDFVPPYKLEAHLSRISTKYRLNQNELIGDLEFHIKNGDIEDADMDMASAIVAAVSNFSVDMKSKGVEKPYPKTHEQFRHFLKTEIPDLSFRLKHPIIKRKINELKEKLRNIDSNEKKEIEIKLNCFMDSVTDSVAYEKENFEKKTTQADTFSKHLLNRSKWFLLSSIGISIYFAVLSQPIAGLIVAVPFVFLGASNYRRYWMNRKESEKLIEQYDANSKRQSAILRDEYEKSIAEIQSTFQKKRNQTFQWTGMTLANYCKSFHYIINDDVTEKERKTFLSNLFQSLKKDISAIVKENAPERGGAILLSESGHPIFFEIENHSIINILTEVSFDILKKNENNPISIEETNFLKLCLGILITKYFQDRIDKETLDQYVDIIISDIKNHQTTKRIKSLNEMFETLFIPKKENTFVHNTKSLELIAEGKSPVSQVDEIKNYLSTLNEHSTYEKMVRDLNITKYFYLDNVIEVHTHPTRPQNRDEALSDMRTDMKNAVETRHIMVCPSAKSGKSFEVWYIKPDDVELIGDF